MGKQVPDVTPRLLTNVPAAIPVSFYPIFNAFKTSDADAIMASLLKHVLPLPKPDVVLVTPTTYSQTTNVTQSVKLAHVVTVNPAPVALLEMSTNAFLATLDISYQETLV